MYYYLYDNYLNNKKSQLTLAKIESRLTDLGINGKINKLSFLKNIKQIINEEIRHGVDTVVVVGNDTTLNQVINLISEFNIAIGFIPIGPNNKIAEILNIPEGEAACDVLSSRIIAKLNLGLINNNYYFITNLELIGDDITINCDDNYLINLEGKRNSLITISNISSYQDLNINNNNLSITVRNQKKFLFNNKYEYSHFQVDKIFINNKKSIPILISDEKKIIKTPATIETNKKKIKIIIGKSNSKKKQ